MILCDLHNKIKQLNPNLYIKTDARTLSQDNLHVSGIYLRTNTRRKVRATVANRNYVHTEHQAYLRDIEAGNKDIFVCGVCLEYIPEYDHYDIENSKILAPGWRHIALTIVKRGYCTLDKAKKVFGSNSLGEQAYDKMSPLSRMYLVKGGQNA